MHLTFFVSFVYLLTLPASDTSVSVYLIHLTNAGKSASTINEAVYAISWAHKLAGLADPCRSDLVKTIREGSIRSVGRCVVKKEPITPEILRQLVNVYGFHSKSSQNYKNTTDEKYSPYCLQESLLNKNF
jgi:hypothetical protein